jgi:hypothetical protein
VCKSGAIGGERSGNWNADLTTTSCAEGNAEVSNAVIVYILPGGISKYKLQHNRVVHKIWCASHQMATASLEGSDTFRHELHSLPFMYFI